MQAYILKFLTIISLIFFIAATLLGFLYPGADRTLGEVQRLFYIHLGAFYGAFLMFCVTLISGAAYLSRRSLIWDHIGLASVEIGVTLSAVNIITGMFVARPVWGVFWMWDARLTSVAIMWLMYASYLFLRAGIENVDLRRRFAAVYGILAFISLLFTLAAFRVSPDIIYPVIADSSAHTESSGFFGMSDRISQTVMVNILAYCAAAITLLWYRVRLEYRREQFAARRISLLEHL